MSPHMKKKDVRCYYCRRKATRVVAGHPSCDGNHGAPASVVPQVRTVRVGALRSGRDAFLRAIRGRIASVPADAYEEGYRKRVLEVVDKTIARYKGA